MFFFFFLTSNWYGLNRLQIRGTKLSNGLLAKKSQISYLFLLVFFKTDEEIDIDCLFYRRKVLHEKWMVRMNLLSTLSASYD